MARVTTSSASPDQHRRRRRRNSYRGKIVNRFNRDAPQALSQALSSALSLKQQLQLLALPANGKRVRVT